MQEHFYTTLGGQLIFQSAVINYVGGNFAEVLTEGKKMV